MFAIVTIYITDYLDPFDGLFTFIIVTNCYLIYVSWSLHGVIKIDQTW